MVVYKSQSIICNPHSNNQVPMMNPISIIIIIVSGLIWIPILIPILIPIWVQFFIIRILF